MHNLPQVNASVLPQHVWYTIQSQWGNRQTNHHYVHAHCVNGGLRHDHELHPKLADDQEAVDAVTRQRDTITRTAADTEVLLPFAQHPDQASTAAPPDDERDLFGREEALRMDEEILNFQWFEHVTWDNIKDLRGTTYVQPPTRFKFALQQAQHAILRAIIHNNPSSLASEPAWKALVLSSWLLLGRPAVNTSESNRAHFLDARLELFWAEDWSAIWAMVRAECDIAPMQDATRRTATQQNQSRVRKVATLARAGEKERAPAAARNAPPVPVTEQIVQEIKSLYLADPEPPAPAQAFVSGPFLSEVAEHIPTTLHKMSRLSEPGPLGMRAEHWYDFGSLAVNTNLFVQVVAHIAAASVPLSVAVSQGRTEHATRQTQKWPQTASHDVLSPQAGTQISNGSKEGISGQMCGTFAVRCWKIRRSKHDDQNHPIPRGSSHLPSHCCS